MKQFLLKEMPDAEGMIRLRGEDYHYLARVRRLRCGSRLEVTLPGGEKAELTVISASGGVLTGLCKTSSTTVNDHETEYQPIILFQGIPRLPKMDLIVRQAAESMIRIFQY
jgi:RsmE family RNA methyltransferase